MALSVRFALNLYCSRWNRSRNVTEPGTVLVSCHNYPLHRKSFISILHACLTLKLQPVSVFVTLSHTHSLSLSLSLQCCHYVPEHLEGLQFSAALRKNPKSPEVPKRA